MAFHGDSRSPHHHGWFSGLHEDLEGIFGGCAGVSRCVTVDSFKLGGVLAHFLTTAGQIVQVHGFLRSFISVRIDLGTVSGGEGIL